MPGIIVTVAAFFGISPLRIIVYGALILSGIIGAIAIHHSIIEKGRALERAVMQARDKAAVGQADKAEADVRRCYEQGGTWRGFNEGGPRCDR